MAVNPQNRLAVFRTVGEAFAITWVLPTPYLVLVVLIMLPWAVMSALGLFDSFHDFTELAARGQEELALQSYPIGAMLVFYIFGYLAFVLFGIFWYRYVLLGPEGALRFGIAELNGMFWRTAGYGLAVLLIYFAAGIGLIMGLSLLGGLIHAISGTSSGLFVSMVTFVTLLVGYLVPLALLARLSLPFPAFALGQRLSMRQSWSLTKGSAWRIVGALLTASLPVSLIAYALYFVLFYSLFRLNPLLPEHAAKSFDYWWFTLLLGPAYFLPLALCLAVVAFAYRDLGRRPAPEAPDLRPSQ